MPGLIGQIRLVGPVLPFQPKTVSPLGPVLSSVPEKLLLAAPSATSSVYPNWLKLQIPLPPEFN